MISFLQGKLILKKDKYIVLDVSGVGYKVFLSQKTLLKIPEIGQNLNPSTKLRIDGEPSRTIKLFCYLNVRENALDLYGFFDEKELEFFEILNSITGIGPKVALEISSLGPLEKIKDRILAQDQKIFEGIPGVGRKRAMTIILELSGKIKDVSLAHPKKETKIDEAEDILVGLGFSRQRVKEALSRVSRDMASEERIKEALRILGKQ
jgi:Holliday junction DNA helicase RuvA